MSHKKSRERSRRKLAELAAKEVVEEEKTASSSSSKSPSKMSVQEKCDLIAELGESILEDPETAFYSTTIEDGGESHKGLSKMRQLLALATAQSNEKEQYTAQLAIMSLLAIFKDIIPSYRIRLPTQQEMAIKVSKDTKKIWDYERNLLHHYQQYLKLLETTWSKNAGSLSMTAMLSLCELLKAAFHFNFRNNLLTLVVRQMNHPTVGTACCQSMEHVFCHDGQGEVSLEAIRQVAKMIKDRQFKVGPDVLRCFAALPLRVHADEAEAAQLVSKANAKKRKRDKETAAIEAELQESQATVDKIVLARCQSDTLQAVILTYFRVLKHDNLKAAHVEQLLPAALEGLAKFAHLINIDTVMDLLEGLRQLLKKVDALPLDAALNCVLTAFSTLQGPGKEMKIDQKEYIVPLYSQLPRLMSETNSQRHTDLALECLDFAFIKRREFSTTRIAAFFKQILTVAMHTPAYTSVPLLAFARQLLQRYPSVQQMLENEQDVITSGQYTPNVEDPEHSNPFATCAWELATLKFHIDPKVANQAVAAASLKMLQMPSESPDRLRAEFVQNNEELYIPFQGIKKKHPLQPKGNEGSNKKRRRNARFITPRKAKCTLIKEE